MDIINNVLTIILTSVMGYVVWLLQGHRKKKDTTSDALRVLLRESIEARYKVYKNKDALTREEYHDFDEMCNVYFELKGNGTGERMYNEIKQKPIKG